MAWGTKQAETEEVTKAPASPPHYVTEVNKGKLNMAWFGLTLNAKHGEGYRLAHVFEQDGNTVMVFEHGVGSSA